MKVDDEAIVFTAEQLKQMISQGCVLSKKYHVTTTNPPYRGMGDVEEKLQSFAKEHYPDSKQDLSTVFMERCQLFTKSNGFYSMINIPVWMLCNEKTGRLFI